MQQDMLSLKDTKNMMININQIWQHESGYHYRILHLADLNSTVVYETVLDNHIWTESAEQFLSHFTLLLEVDPNV